MFPILKKYQPDAVVFQGPRDFPQLLRWVGNERGEAPYPCWSRSNHLTAEDGTKERKILGGFRDGNSGHPPRPTCPTETATTPTCAAGSGAREKTTCSTPSNTWSSATTSVSGENTNLLLGMVIDNRGLVPEADRKRFEEFGAELTRRLGRPLASTCGVAKEIQLDCPAGKQVSQIILMEDCADGEDIEAYLIEALCDGKWRKIAEGSCVGHKRIERFEPVCAVSFRLSVKTANGVVPRIRCFAIYT